MAGKKGNKKHANSTSFPNQKNNTKSRKVVIRKFMLMLENAKVDDNILCFQDACQSINWRVSKIDYWIKKIPKLSMYKKDVQDTILSRINKKALLGQHVPAPAIWRMKQLGEKDEQKINHQNNGGEFKSSTVSVSQIDKEAIKIIADKLDDV